jgi:hypothetical protein
MQRRTLLGLGLTGGALLAVAGGGIAWVRGAASRGGRLLGPGREVLTGVARAVLDGSLPVDAASQAVALEAHLERVQHTLAALPPSSQSELADLLRLLALAPTRRLLCGLSRPWDRAELADMQAALRFMRDSSLLLRRQAYGALRDLTHAAYFADAAAWPVLRYPGPRALA